MSNTTQEDVHFGSVLGPFVLSSLVSFEVYQTVATTATVAESYVSLYRETDA